MQAAKVQRYVGSRRCASPQVCSSFNFTTPLSFFLPKGHKSCFVYAVAIDNPLFPVSFFYVMQQQRRFNRIAPLFVMARRCVTAAAARPFWQCGGHWLLKKE